MPAVKLLEASLCFDFWPYGDVCERVTDPLSTSLWGDRCDALRRATLSAQLEEIRASFVGQEDR